MRHTQLMCRLRRWRPRSRRCSRPTGRLQSRSSSCCHQILLCMGLALDDYFNISVYNRIDVRPPALLYTWDLPRVHGTPLIAADIAR